MQQIFNTMKITETYSFNPIRLDEMDRVKLMNRTDTKYWFHTSQLQNLLHGIQENYFMLNINGEMALPYSTVYYDTKQNKMFAAHHNGKLNRYKIRRRSYVSSGISFLEVKFKNNKGRTIKKRIPSDFNHNNFTIQEREFLNTLTPFSVNELHSSLVNNFSRITLVNKNFRERCTIDFNLQFETSEKHIWLDNLVIVEIKSEGSPSNSPLARALRDQRIKTSGFSKYCVGRTVTDARLKRNAFKHKIRSIEKIIQSGNNLYGTN
jgi:hypothetical protein